MNPEALHFHIRRQPSFRDHATWPLRVLVARADTPERRAIEEMDDALVQSARALLKISKTKSIQKRLFPVASKGIALPSTGKCDAEIRAQELLIRRTILKNQIVLIAERGWSDLVCADDYFYPSGGRMLKKPSSVQAGEFVVSLNPELQGVCDFVARCALLRIECWKNSLEEYGRHCRDASGGAQPRNDKQVRCVEESWARLHSCYAAVRKALLAGPDVQLRDSCIVLVQTYAAFHPAPQLDWLGLGPTAQFGINSWRHAISHARDTEMSDRIATAIGDLRRWYGDLPPDASAFDAAVASGGLVLVTRPRLAFWDAEPIDVDWDKYTKPWAFLWKLAEKARLSAAVDSQDVYDSVVSDSAMANLRSRLAQLIPRPLGKLIVPGERRQSYRLDLASNRISFHEKYPHGVG